MWRTRAIVWQDMKRTQTLAAQKREEKELERRNDEAEMAQRKQVMDEVAELWVHEVLRYEDA